MKDEPASLVQSRYARIDQPALSSRRDWRAKAMKEEVPSAIAKTRGRLLYYLAALTHLCRGASSRRRRGQPGKRRNATRHWMFAKSDEAPAWVHEDPDLAEASAHD